MAQQTTVPITLREEIHSITSATGSNVNAWLLFHQPTDGTNPQHHHSGILYCHGNHHHLGSYAQRAAFLWSLGYIVLIFDYPGYGKMTGSPSEEGSYTAARAARRYFNSRDDLHINQDRIALYGFSLGSAICSRLAYEEQSPALILEAPFTSVSDLINDNATWPLPVEWFSSCRFPTIDNTRMYQGTLLIMTGEKDYFLNPNYGRAIFHAATTTQKTLWQAPNADHGSIPCSLERSSSESLPFSQKGDLFKEECPEGFSATYEKYIIRTLDEVIPPN